MRTLQRGSRNRRLTLSHTLPLALAVLEVAGATAAFSRPFSRSSYELSSAPATVTLADLDGDGDLDLAAAARGQFNAAAQTWQGIGFTVSLNDGSGSFGTSAFYALSSRPAAIAAADFDGDGDIDIAAAVDGVYLQSYVAVVPNNGDATFGAETLFETGYNPFDLAVADIDDDGDADLMTANYFDSNLSVLVNAGDGSFGAPRNNYIGKYPREVISGDVNGDGAPDLAVSYKYGVKILTNLGDGFFSQAAVQSAYLRPTTLAFGDVDGDGAIDLAVGSGLNDVVELFLNDSGAYSSAASTYLFDQPATTLGFADVDGDSDADLLVPTYYGSVVNWLVNDGAGGIGSKRYAVPVGADPTSLASGDLDGNGTLDVVVGNSGDGTMTVFLRNN